MKLKKHLYMFIREQVWVVLLFLMSSLFSAGFFLTSGNLEWGNILYYSGVPLVLLGVFLSYRLYATWNYYELFFLEAKNVEEFMLAEGRCQTEKDIQSLLVKIIEIYHLEQSKKDRWQETQKLMVYQWVHQVKTPLSVIHLITQNHKMEKDYRKIEKMGTAMQYNLDQLLAMYRLERMDKDFLAEKVNLYELARYCVNEQKSSFIEYEIYPMIDINKDIYVHTDQKWMRFVIGQLLTNAMKYSSKGEHVYLMAAMEEGKILLHVKDNGCGIAKEDEDRVFDLFFTGVNGRQYGESSGLGLYMVKKIIDFLGHSIKVTSQLEAGSTFTIEFGSDIQWENLQ